LIVRNIGNIELKDYPIQIDLNGKPFVKKINLDLGEEQKFKLTGDGTYDVKISDGQQELLQSGVVLTGRAIGVQDIKKAGSIALNTPIVWIFLIVILLGVGLFFFRDIFKKKSFAYPFKETLKRKFSKKPKILELETGQVKKKETDSAQKDSSKEQEKSGESDIDKKEKKEVTPSNQAEKVLVLDGQKSKATIIIIKIKNKLSKHAKQNLEKAIEHVYEKKAAVYEKGDCIFVIFSPLMTKSFKNEKEAAKAAERILLILNEHNKKFKEKIDFGIGIHSGDIINKVENKKLRFTALGNLIPGAKRLADASEKNILMTKETYERAINDIKAVKKKTKDGEVYEVKRVLDREKNQEFIRAFLNRMDKDNKGNENQTK